MILQADNLSKEALRYTSAMSTKLSCVQEFVEAALAKGDFADPETDSRLHSRMRDAYLHLVSAPSGPSAIGELLRHPSVHVRLWVATQRLAEGDLAAKPVLEGIAATTGLTAFAAQVTLAEFGAGNLQPPFRRVGRSARRESASDGHVAEQVAVCRRFGADYCAAPSSLKAGVALSTLRDLPLNALRHPATADTTGWYIWGGTELSQAADFFRPLHVHHLSSLCPNIMPYLGLAPGWRVLVAPAHDDVWFDPGLLRI